MRTAQVSRLPPFPEGWFRVASAAEVPRSGVITRRLWGTEVVVFRTQAGEAAVVDPVCPHLGAHLGRGGRVVGETLRCPFHGFRYGTDGRCVATGYSGRAVNLRVRTWPTVERWGQVFAFLSHDRRPPDWHLPHESLEGWSAPVTRTLHLQGHVQDTSENAVDLGHLGVVHDYRNVRNPRLEIDGPCLWSRFAFDRAHPFLPMGRVTALFDTQIWGLGFSRTDVRVESLGMGLKLLLMATPIDETHFDFTVAVCTETPPSWADGRLPARLPWGAFGRLLARFSLRAIVQDVAQDHAIWAHKRHVNPPGLVDGDGPIGAFRKWARQFYPEAAAPPSPGPFASSRVGDGAS